jgi:hypothetical protein
MSEEKDWKSRISTERYAPGRRERPLTDDKVPAEADLAASSTAGAEPAPGRSLKIWNGERIAAAGLIVSVAILGFAALSAIGNLEPAYRTAKKVAIAVDRVLDPPPASASPAPAAESRKAPEPTKQKAAAPASKPQAFTGLRFIDVSEAQELERLLSARPSSRRPYDCLNRNDFVVGAAESERLMVIPSVEGKDARSQTAALCALRLVIVAVPRELRGGEDQLDALKRKWAKGTSVTTAQIDAWSRTVSPSGEETGRCEVGGRCYILTRDWPPETFSEFNRYDTAVQ